MESISPSYLVFIPCVSFFDLTFHSLINSYFSYHLLKALFHLSTARLLTLDFQNISLQSCDEQFLHLFMF